MNELKKDRQTEKEKNGRNQEKKKNEEQKDSCNRNAEFHRCVWGGEGDRVIKTISQIHAVSLSKERKKEFNQINLKTMEAFSPTKV